MRKYIGNHRINRLVKKQPKSPFLPKALIHLLPYLCKSASHRSMDQTLQPTKNEKYKPCNIYPKTQAK